VQKLEEELFGVGAIPALLMSRDEFRASASDHFLILLLLLGGMAIAALGVGSFGMATAISVTVMERFREIGVMRAMGGDDRAIAGLFHRETTIAAMSAILVAMLIALPLSALIGAALGAHGLHVAIPFRLSLLSCLVWIVLGLAIAWVATRIPVQGALRVPTREMLAHE
jgi:putative ABC transport system permease protein